MLLPSKKDHHLTPIFTSKAPKEIGVHAVRLTKNGKAEDSTELYAHWNGTKWGPTATTPKLARPADVRGRGRARIEPLQHCLRWVSASTKKEAVKLEKPQAEGKAKGALETLLQGSVATKPVEVSRKVSASPRRNTTTLTKGEPKVSATSKPRASATDTEAVNQVRSCIASLLSDKKVHHIDVILNHVSEELGSGKRSLVDSALLSLLRSGEVMGKSGLVGSVHEMFFLVPIDGDEPLLASAEDAAIADATMKAMLPLVSTPAPGAVTAIGAVAPAPAPVSVPAPALPRSGEAAESAPVFHPQVRGQLVSPVMLGKILDAVQLGILSRGPMTFGRLMDDLDVMNVELGVTGEALSASLRAGILRGLIEITDKYSGQELRYTVGQFGESVPANWEGDSVEPAALLHELLEILFVSDRLGAYELARRARSLFPKSLVTIQDVHSAMAQGLAAGIAFSDGNKYSLKGMQARPTFELTDSGATIRAGSLKIELNEQMTRELSARLQERYGDGKTKR